MVKTGVIVVDVAKLNAPTILFGIVDVVVLPYDTVPPFTVRSEVEAIVATLR